MGQYQSIYNGSQVDDCVSQAVRTIVQQLTDAQKSQVRTNIGAGTYSIPSGGIPRTSLTTDVQTSLSKADTALPLSGGKMTGSYIYLTSGISVYDATESGINLYDNIMYLASSAGVVGLAKLGTNGFIFNLNNFTGVRTVYINSTGGFQPESSNTVTLGGLGSEYAELDSRVVYARHVNGSRTYAQSGNADLYLNYYGGVYPAGNTYINADNNGLVGIGTYSPSYKLHVSGTVGATGFVNYSDVRKKVILDNVNIDIRYIADTPIFKYTWLDKRMGQNVNIGTSAQYWKMILPEIVSEANDSDRTLSMQYDVAGLVSSVILARKIVEQEETIKLQDTRIKELEKIVDDIQSKLDKQKL